MKPNAIYKKQDLCKQQLTASVNYIHITELHHASKQNYYSTYCLLIYITHKKSSHWCSAVACILTSSINSKQFTINWVLKRFFCLYNYIEQFLSMNISLKGITLILQKDILHPYTCHAVQMDHRISMIWNSILNIWEVRTKLVHWQY